MTPKVTFSLKSELCLGPGQKEAKLFLAPRSLISSTIKPTVPRLSYLPAHAHLIVRLARLPRDVTHSELQQTLLCGWRGASGQTLRRGFCSRFWSSPACSGSPLRLTPDNLGATGCCVPPCCGHCSGGGRPPRGRRLAGEGP